MALAGVSASSHELRTSTTTPMPASKPKARRSRVAVGVVITSTRARRSTTNCLAARPTKIISATARVLSSMT